MSEWKAAPRARLAFAIVFAGMFIASLTSPLLKSVLSEGVSPNTATFYRLFVATVALWPVLLTCSAYRKELGTIGWGDFLLFALSGTMQALDLFFWSAALNHSPIFLMSAISNLNPIWVIIASYLFLKEKTPLRSLYGVALCLSGMLIVAFGGMIDANNQPIGMAMVLICSICFGLNMVVMRRLRRKFTLWPTMCLSFSVGTAVMFLLCAVTHSKMGGLSLNALVLLGIISIVCTLARQAANVWALKKIPATTVSLLTLLMPFFAGIAAFVLRGEIPNLTTVLGCAVMVAGLYVYFRMLAKAQRDAAQQQDALPDAKQGSPAA